MVGSRNRNAIFNGIQIKNIHNKRTCTKAPTLQSMERPLPHTPTPTKGLILNNTYKENTHIFVKIQEETSTLYRETKHMCVLHTIIL